MKKSENQFTKYLKTITNEQLIQFYNDVEWTPFPILVIKEYQRRFESANNNIVSTKLMKTSKLDKTKTGNSINAEYHNTTTPNLHQNNKKKSSKPTKYPPKKISLSPNNIVLLERLSELAQKGIITNKEFQTKKKEILKRI